MVRRGTTGAEAARVIAEYRLSGLVVADEAGVPIAVVPGSQVLSLVLPQYVRDEPNLSHAYDERGADELCRVLNEATIGELLEAKKLTGLKPPSVLPEDTLIEAASAMDSGHTPLILVIDRAALLRRHHPEPPSCRHRHRGRSGQPAGAAPAGARRTAPRRYCGVAAPVGLGVRGASNRYRVAWCAGKSGRRSCSDAESRPCPRRTGAGCRHDLTEVEFLPRPGSHSRLRDGVCPHRHREVLPHRWRSLARPPWWPSARSEDTTSSSPRTPGSTGTSSSCCSG